MHRRIEIKTENSAWEIKLSQFFLLIAGITGFIGIMIFLFINAIGNTYELIPQIDGVYIRNVEKNLIQKYTVETIFEIKDHKTFKDKTFEMK